jgi:hypothetical protein
MGSVQSFWLQRRIVAAAGPVVFEVGRFSAREPAAVDGSCKSEMEGYLDGLCFDVHVASSSPS